MDLKNSDSGQIQPDWGDNPSVPTGMIHAQPVDHESIEMLLSQARAGSSPALGQLLQLYRNYLSILATIQFDRRLRGRMNPSDLVQETLLAAHGGFANFRGASEREFLPWLRQILINCLRTAIDTHVRAQKRDLRREISIEQASQTLERSAFQLIHALADRGPSPSEPMRQREMAVVLADRLSQLRPIYRDVIVLRNLHGLPFNEIAERLERKPGHVRMLWLRAIDKFKRVYTADDSTPS
jgi:RNA polymerase sigma-70 factor (ECF subfamily)